MAIYFIADLHLSTETPARVSLLEGFLESIIDEAEALYVLGDLFEVWLGDDAIPQELHPLLARFQDFSRRVPVFFQAGNRDFLIGQEFAHLSGMQLLPEIEVKTLYSRKILLMHGDLLCSDDVAYMQFRQQVRNPEWIAHFLSLDISQRIAMAKQAREQSQQQNATKEDVIMDANPHTVDEYMTREGVQYLIHGHTHRPAIHQLSSSSTPSMRAVVGDWHDQPSYIRLDEREIRLVDPRIEMSQSVKTW